MAYHRETAHRVTSQEYNASTIKLDDGGDKTPKHVLTPLGCKINRIHVVGVCTGVESVGESGEVYRARVSDPLGVFRVYAGARYQPEAALALSQLTPPCYVAVTGKVKSYEPEPGKFIVSISPESVNVVDEATRDHYVLDAVKCTQERLEAVQAFMEGAKTHDELVAAGVRGSVAEGVLLAAEHYGVLNPEGYAEALQACLQGLLPGGSFETHVENPVPSVPVSPPKPFTAPEVPKEATADEEAFDEAILGIVTSMDDGTGAQWDFIVEEAKTKLESASEESVETSLNRLMDKGLVYEPTLGVIRAT